MQAFADIVRQGKALYIGVSEWTADQLRAGQELAKGLGFRIVSNQPQYSMLWRVIEPEVVPTSSELGISQIVWSPVAQGVLTGKYLRDSLFPSALARQTRTVEHSSSRDGSATTCSTGSRRCALSPTSSG